MPYFHLECLIHVALINRLGRLCNMGCQRASSCNLGVFDFGEVHGILMKASTKIVTSSRRLWFGDVKCGETKV